MDIFMEEKEAFVVPLQIAEFTQIDTIKHYPVTTNGICPGCTKQVADDKKIIINNIAWHSECMKCSVCNDLVTPIDCVWKKGILMHKKCFEDAFGERCAKCGEFVDTEIAVKAIGKSYHPQCFKCTKCGDGEKIKEKCINLYGHPYCLNCFQAMKNLFPICPKCKNPVLPTDEKREFFDLGKKYFAHVKCFTCSHCPKVPLPGDMVILDGEMICAQCLKDARQRICASCNKPVFGPRAELEGIVWHPEHFKCSKCGQQLQSNIAVLDHGTVKCRRCHMDQIEECRVCHSSAGVDLEACGGKFHTRCFNCRFCNKNLANDGFITVEGLPSCLTCFKQGTASGKIDKHRRIISV